MEFTATFAPAFPFALLGFIFPTTGRFGFFRRHGCRGGGFIGGRLCCLGGRFSLRSLCCLFGFGRRNRLLFRPLFGFQLRLFLPLLRLLGFAGSLFRLFLLPLELSTAYIGSAFFYFNMNGSGAPRARALLDCRCGPAA